MRLLRGNLRYYLMKTAGDGISFHGKVINPSLWTIIADYKISSISYFKKMKIIMIKLIGDS